jgi:hypothetical protein
LFALFTTINVGSFPHSVASSDVNGDNKPDLVCANYGANTLSVLTNNGSGGFALSALLNVGSAPYSVTSADFNGDGKPDLVCANVSGNTLTVFINNGGGGFSSSSTLNNGGFPQFVTTADVNGDGKIDLISTGSRTVVLTNNGSGGLAISSTNVASGSLSAVAIATTDINGDGRVDLIWGNDNGGNGTTLSVFTNNGNGSFGTNTTLTVGAGPFSVVAADINGDNRFDLVCANRSSDTLSALINADTFTPSGSVRVNLAPSGAVSGGAQWRVDGGIWQNSGATVYRLSGGNHTVTFSTVTGWNTPSDQAVVINTNQITTVTGSYVQQFGSLLVNLEPLDVVNAGAKWQVDGGAWQNSGAIVSGLTVGSHSVTFNTVPDWTTPAGQSAVIVYDQTTTNFGTYSPLGRVQVNLAPAGAVNAGAQWRVDGGSWQSSGATVANLTLGSHSLSFLPVTDWATPSNQTVVVSSNQTTTVAVNYGQLFGSVQVNIGPASAVTAGARWQVDGGIWQNSGAVVSGLTLGGHALSFSTVPGWGTPGNQNISINANQTTVVGTTYASPRPATATAITNNGFVVAVTITDGGVGYTNTPQVYLVGGGGTGAVATATVSNGVVTGITILNAGFGYTNPPLVAIAPPFPLTLGIAPATVLAFSGLQAGTNYQLQILQSETWGNLGSSFMAAGDNFTQHFDGTVNGSMYRLMALPIPYGATATPNLAFGFVVAATINDGGSGYVSVPAVQIIGGGGSGAQASAVVSNGVVMAINIGNAGSGYTDTPTIQIDPPPVPALLPSVAKAFRLDYNGLTPALTYQLQASPDLSGWTNFGTNFTATDYTNSQYLNFGTNSQFFRLTLP